VDENWPARPRGSRSRTAATPRHLRRALVAILVVALAAGLVVALRPAAPSRAQLQTRVRQAVLRIVAAGPTAYRYREVLSLFGQSRVMVGHGVCDLRVLTCVTHAYYQRGASQYLAENPITSRFVDGVEYVHYGPKLASELPTPWISQATVIAPGVARTRSPATQVPHQGLAMLARPGARVVDLGGVTLFGRAVHQYQVRVSDAPADRILGSRFPLWMRLASRYSEQRDVVVRLDVNAAGRIVWIRVRATLPDDEGLLTHVVETWHAVGFHSALSVAAPPAPEVTPYAVLRALQGATSSPSRPVIRQ
jgi:hypothetical protein